MNFFVRLLALVRRPQPVAAPPAAYSDAEFTEAVARRWRERYTEKKAPASQNFPETDQVAA